MPNLSDVEGKIAIQFYCMDVLHFFGPLLNKINMPEIETLKNQTATDRSFKTYEYFGQKRNIESFMLARTQKRNTSLCNL